MQTNDIRASVAMAVYNGEPYIHEQIDSVIQRMGPQDELVISYDVSKDNTKQIIDDYASKDPRVRVVENPGPGGVQNNFTNAVMHCRGKYIFLADQDDVWIGDKIQRVVDTFAATGADLVVHDGHMVDGALQIMPGTIFDRYGKYDNPLLNIIKCNYWGCCMAFKQEMRELVCPFPTENRVGHDWWLGILAGFHGKIVRIEECFILHRIHDNNQTELKTRALPVVLKHRATLIKLLCQHAFSRKK